MSELKAGQVAIIRTTEEPVFIIKITTLENSIATVRRPTQTDNGIVHVIEDFYVAELESMDDKKKRLISEYAEFTTTQKALQNQNAPANQTNLFGN